MTVHQAIDQDDLEALQGALRDTPASANQIIEWGPGGKNRTHPLHYLCDRVFNGALPEARAIEMVNVLLAAGSDVNFKLNETPLHGAASLNAEQVGLHFLDAGARVDLLGAQGETALHWAAYCGLPRLVERILAVAGESGLVLAEIRDAQHGGTPLDWSGHGEKRYGGARYLRVRELLRG